MISGAEMDVRDLSVRTGFEPSQLCETGGTFLAGAHQPDTVVRNHRFLSLALPYPHSFARLQQIHRAFLESYVQIQVGQYAPKDWSMM